MSIFCGRRFFKGVLAHLGQRHNRTNVNWNISTKSKQRKALPVSFITTADYRFPEPKKCLSFHVHVGRESTPAVKGLSLWQTCTPPCSIQVLGEALSTQSSALYIYLTNARLPYGTGTPS